MGNFDWTMGRLDWIKDEKLRRFSKAGFGLMLGSLALYSFCNGPLYEKIVRTEGELQRVHEIQRELPRMMYSFHRSRDVEERENLEFAYEVAVTERDSLMDLLEFAEQERTYERSRSNRRIGSLVGVGLGFGLLWSPIFRYVREEAKKARGES